MSPCRDPIWTAWHLYLALGWQKLAYQTRCSSTKTYLSILSKQDKQWKKEKLVLVIFIWCDTSQTHISLRFMVCFWKQKNGSPGLSFALPGQTSDPVHKSQFILTNLKQEPNQPPCLAGLTKTISQVFFVKSCQLYCKNWPLITI